MKNHRDSGLNKPSRDSGPARETAGPGEGRREKKKYRDRELRAENRNTR